MAFLLIPHLDPTHESLMVELLAKHSAMPVSEASHGTRVSPNHVYIIPPNKYLAIKGSTLRLSQLPEPRRLQTAIDFSLRSLADDQKERAIGIILSGTGSHGTLGVKEIKLAGGMVMVQSPDSAEYDQMPRSAIATGLIDYVLAPGDMPEALLKYAQHSYLNREPAAEAPVRETEHLSRIFAVLRAHTRHDFSCFRKNMVMRRVQRRMGLCHIDQIDAYLAYLRAHEREVSALSKDLLIGVTAFFREPEAFRALEESVLPALAARFKDADRSVRVWVPACATGEEAYSIAILFREHLTAGDSIADLQIFATDIDEASLEVARHGLYPASVAADIARSRLQQWFTKVDEDHYQVNRAVRESIVFAPQDLLGDAPFSRLDLISCRNLLIYLEPAVQQKVISLLHFALNPDGYLLLGPSESVGRAMDLFEPVSKKWRIYRRIGPPRRELVDIPIVGASERLTAVLPGLPARPRVRFPELLQRLVLQQVTPASVLINRRYEILSVVGPVVNYLEFPPGELTKDLLSLVRQGLRTKLRTSCHRAIRDDQIVTDDGLRVKRDGTWVPCALTVRPVTEPEEAAGLLLVSFQDLREQQGATGNQRPGAVFGEESVIVQQLEQELKTTREELQSTIEEMESSNEELKASNEEVMSMNEELQSSNEELESSKEELQSLNEELSTVNSQLQDKVEELDTASSDMNNLLSSTDIATVFLDTSLRIKRFTPALTRLLNVIATDVGRPLRDFASQVAGESLIADCRRVLETLTTVTVEVATDEDRHYSRRVLPYRTADDRIEGVVVTWIDITSLKRIERELRAAQAILTERVTLQDASLTEANQALRSEVDHRRRVQTARDSLLHRFITLQDEERRIISRELHDRAAQELAALALEHAKIRNAIARKDGDLSAVDLAERITKVLDAQLRDVALELRPTVLDDLGLERALSAYVESWSARHQIPADFHGDGGEFEELSSVAKVNLYRILQEALANVHKHARASRVNVVLEHRRSHLQLVIEDDGVGFDAEETLSAGDRGTLGLLGMRERAAMVGGELQVEASHGRGTTVFARLPRHREKHQ